ncbi:hypothetical protein WL86_29905 [Burkholderia diffusa]|nr:hypothetical protein WL86_29905 [Burkholderia diffusa]
MAHGKHVGAISRQAVAFCAIQGLLLLRIVFCKTGIEFVDERNIEAIQPYDRLSPFGGRRISVVVPRPRRSDDEVARLHGRAFTIDRSPCAFAFYDEAQRRLRMTMTGGDLARKNQLESGIERRRDSRFAWQTGILKHEYASHRLLGGNELPSLHDEWADILVAPQSGNDPRTG